MNHSAITIPADLQDFAAESAARQEAPPEQRFMAWARLGAAIEKAGLTWQQCAELMESVVPSNVLAAVATNRNRAGLGGSPVLEAWQRCQEHEVGAGTRSSESLKMFTPETVASSKVTFAQEAPEEGSDE